MSYDINEYTDDQCFDMLDLNNPSDRELEMKILQQMDKYERKSKRLYQFFEQMYDRFFADEGFADEGHDDDVVEGFDGTDRFQYNGNSIPPVDNQPSSVPNSQINVEQQMQQTRPGGAAQVTNLPVEGNVAIKKIDDSVVAKAASSDTRLVDYVKDPLKLNPTSQKTIFKMISIDSQYREDSQNTRATNFSLNLSEDLRNVISMKLYSVQIPYTWYTINNDFGSNYFFLKGNSPGIDNGQHDVKVQIRSGTYTPGQIATAINTSIAILKSKDITDPQYNSIYDLSFGQTFISYNTANSQSSKIVFEFDLKKTFNETDYSLYFPNWTSPNTEGGAKSSSIPSFLGYNYNTYLPYIAYSEAFATYFDTNPNFTIIDNSNNYFQIIQYTGSSYANRTSTHETINITLAAGTYPRNALITSFNNAIKSADKIDSIYSYFQLTTINDTANINNGKKRIELAAKLNRATTKQIAGSKLAIVFPDESTINSNAKIWTGNSSCFRFSSNTIELNNIVSETPTSITNYIIGNNVGVLLTCVKPGYDIPLNTFNTQTPSGDYILNDYINAINYAFTLWKDGQNNAVNVVDASLTLIDSSPKVGFNILKEFTEVDYNIVLSSSVFNRGQILGFDTSYNSNYSPTSNITSFSTIEINGDNRKIILQPKNNLSVGNYLAAPIEVLLTETNPLDINQLFSSINTDFANSEYMKGSNISYIQNEGGLTLTLILNVSVKLTSNDYKASFIDANSNSWDNNFGISSEPYDLLLNNPVIGTKSIFNNLITLSTLNNNNQIIFRPVNPVLTGGNDIIFEIPSLTYTRTELIEKINTLFYQNPITRNSTITIDNNNISTVKMTINKTYTSADFRLVFYDIFSFVYCNVGVSNVQNVKWDTTLGWILGFHTYTEYNLSEFAKLGSGQISSNIFSEEYQNYFNNIYGRITAPDSPTDPGDIANTGFISTQAIYTNSNSSDGRLAIIGDSVCNTNLYNYFLLVIDDFIQNHVNDGLITIASVENDIPLPSYTSQISYQCDPITGRKIAGISTNNQFTSLTAKQLYSMNQIIEARRSLSTYTAGPYMRDVFGLIPVKLAGLSFGSTYMEFGGTLQNQNRKYFGPVNIKKMSIKLMNDRGNVVDLNGTNWSFTLICEILNTAT
jgi:hypothetical protein